MMVQEKLLHSTPVQSTLFLFRFFFFLVADTLWQIFINSYLFLQHKRKCSSSQRVEEQRSCEQFSAAFRLLIFGLLAEVNLHKKIIGNMFCAFDQKLPAQIEMFTPTDK